MIFDSLPEDRVASPYTGWTRAHWEDLADCPAGRGPRLRDQAARPGRPARTGQPLRPAQRRPRGIRPHLPARRLPARRTSGDTDPAGHAEWYAAGPGRGHRPGLPRALAADWQSAARPRSSARRSPSRCTRPRPGIWDRLERRVRQRIVAWMTGIAGTAVPDNNWVWFRADHLGLPALGRRAVERGRHRPRDRAHRAVVRGRRLVLRRRREPCGQLRDFDYYTGWAMHFYPLWYCRISGPLGRTRPAPAATAHRLRRYLDDAQHLVGRAAALRCCRAAR